MRPVPKPGPAPTPPRADRDDLPGYLASRPRGQVLANEASRALGFPVLWRAEAMVADAERGKAGASWLEVAAVRLGRVVRASCMGNRAELRVELEAAAELFATWADAVERRG